MDNDRIRIENETELPTEVHGFAVEIFVGPYPITNRRSHRRAIYARLRPGSEDLMRKLKKIGRTHILGWACVDRATADDLKADRLLDNEREQLALAALRPAAKLAKEVAEA